MRSLSSEDLRERLTDFRHLAQRPRSRWRRGPKVDFEAEGLLEGCETEEDREARAELLDQLLDAGVELDELKSAIAENRLSLLPVERVLTGDGDYTLADVAERSGLDEEFVRRHLSALGLGHGDEDDQRFDDDDVDAASLVKEFLDAGLPQQGLLEVARVLGQGMSRTAEAIGTLMGEAFLQPGDTERDLGLRYAEATEKLAPMMEPLLTYVLRLHLLELVRSEVVDRATLSSGEFPGASPVTVCFADLVGFTRLGEEIPADELEQVAGRLTELATEAADGPVRFVKTIGDAVMLVSTEVEPLLETALTLVDRAEYEDERFPPLRAGLAHGQAIRRWGDWYGRPVNLAHRVTEVARPASVLATEEVCDALGHEQDGQLQWSKAGRRRLKGVQKPVPLFRVRRRDGDE
ncbi:MAG TPA: adenylate cyclase regulatory domain-containing protein [Thermoleophilaceae bacterium]|nr:adenylate cyclase regulatory domain-containing protein [Thermoleophilaceae bacterium]